MNTPVVQLQTHRFTFSDEVSEILMDFARIHQYDERKIYKEAWQTLLQDEDTSSILMKEAETIQQDGYVGDVLDKMFKSTRYYYRKKLLTESKQSNIVKSPRKEYETVPNYLLEEIDKHIKQEIAKQMIQQPITTDKTLQVLVSRATPAKSFEQYYIEYKNRELENDEELIDKEKLKKTYKNRFYKIRILLSK
jgi:hypothetical protein